METVSREELASQKASEEVVAATPVVDPATSDSTGILITAEQLPSRFLAYPAGTTISYKPYSFGEVERWSHGKMTLEQKIELTFANIETRGITKEQIVFEDLLLIMVLRKLTTFSKNEWRLSYTCPGCQEYISSSRSLSEIIFQDLTEIEELPIILDLPNGDTLEFTPFTVDDMMVCRRISPERSAEVELPKMVRNKTYEEAKKIILENKDSDIIQALQMIDEILDFGRQYIECACPKCGHKAEVTVKGVSQLAEPFRRDEVSIKHLISFGKKKHG